MNLLMLDISGKVTKYTFWVSEAIRKSLYPTDSIVVYASMYKSEERDYKKFSPNLAYKKLLNMIPEKYKRSFSILKRLIKSVEVLLNYIYVICSVKVKGIDVVHTQYIPFADFISIEYYAYKLIHLLCPNTKLVLTIHDVLPHDLKPENKEAYCKRYSKVASMFDAYMVHTRSCKEDVINYLHLPEGKIHIAYHPIFESVYVKPSKNEILNNKRIRLIMFGLQTPYKGTDILIDALNELPIEISSRYEVTIAGSIEETYLKDLQKKCCNISVEWLPYFVPEKDLDERINESNIIVLPYRSISQSGVLLLSLFFKKLIITSNLPSFKESLEGYEKQWFFETGNANDLARLLRDIVEGKINVRKQQQIIDDLNEKYSPARFAERTIAVYKDIQ